MNYKVYFTRKVYEKLYLEVRNQFVNQIKSELGESINFDIKDENPLWTSRSKAEKGSKGEDLFYKYIDQKHEFKSNLYLLQKYNSIKNNLNSSQLLVIRSHVYVEVILNYLKLEGDTIQEKLDDFFKRIALDEKLILEQKQIEQAFEFKRNTIDDNINEIFELRNKLNAMIYARILCNTTWWFYFYGYDKHRLRPEVENTWSLIKLVFRFKDFTDGKLAVEIENTATTEHYSYEGSVDFTFSRTEVIVANLYTLPFYGRQLNIKLHVGSGKGNIFLGQFLNYESDNHIISGSIILQRIDTDLNPDFEPEPTVHYIPHRDKYTEDIDGVSQYILQYLHEKKQNFRRTPNRAGHDLSGLKKWLETRESEANQRNNLIGI